MRLKRYIEMRGADGGPGRRICALPALWVGLLYDQAALDGAWEIVKDWTAEERQALREAVPTTALATPFRNRTVRDIARDVVALARGGPRPARPAQRRGLRRDDLPLLAGGNPRDRRDAGRDPAAPVRDGRGITILDRIYQGLRLLIGQASTRL